MSTTPSPQSGPSAATPSRSGSFRTPSHSRNNSSSETKYCTHDFLDVGGSDTLDKPLSFAHLVWPPDVKQGGQARNQRGPHDCGTASSGTHPHARHEHADSVPHTGLIKIGWSYLRCFLEMGDFIAWDPIDMRIICNNFSEAWWKSIHKRMQKFGYYEDINGKSQDDLVPKYSSSCCAHRHQDEPKHAQASEHESKDQRRRGDQKAPAQTVDSSLLADCRKFPSFRESNAEQRTLMSNDASLTDVMRSLNRTTLLHVMRNGANPVFIELAAVVALLNHAAAIYWEYANDLEGYMQTALSKEVVEFIFHMVYSTRSIYIEDEEWRASTSAESGADATKTREDRRLKIENQFGTKVPDVVDLRDGVQSVLFTFVWITETAFQGPDAATASTLHVLLPLLQTVFVRCVAQAVVMQECAAVRTSLCRIGSPEAPLYHELQRRLLGVSAALQTFSGCGLPLYTSDVYRPGNETSGKKGKKAKGKKGKKKKVGFNYSLVTCSYTAHMYTAAFSDLAFRLLQRLTLIPDTSEWISQPDQKDHKIGCTCEKNEEGSTMARNAALQKGLILVERTQHDWKPSLVPGSTASKGKKKKKKSSSAAKAVESKVMDVSAKKPATRFVDILLDRIEEFEPELLKGYDDQKPAAGPAKTTRPADAKPQSSNQTKDKWTSPPAAVSTTTLSLSPPATTSTKSVSPSLYKSWAQSGAASAANPAAAVASESSTAVKPGAPVNPTTSASKAASSPSKGLSTPTKGSVKSTQTPSPSATSSHHTTTEASTPASSNHSSSTAPSSNSSRSPSAGSSGSAPSTKSKSSPKPASFFGSIPLPPPGTKLESFPFESPFKFATWGDAPPGSVPDFDPKDLDKMIPKLSFVDGDTGEKSDIFAFAEKVASRMRKGR